MPDHEPTKSQVVPPHVQLIQMGQASIVSRIVYAAAKLGLADQLASGPKSAAELADGMQVHAPSLHRLMRTLASLGILTEQTEQRFALTDLGKALKTGAPGSAKSTLLFMGSPWQQSSWNNLVYSVQTGKPGFEKAQGVSFFDYLAQHPDDASLFSETMVGFHNQEPPAVAAAYDFSIFNTIVDVGGATGNMLSAVVSQHPGPRGILFDRQHVVKDAPPLLEAKAVSDRITIEAGDFFTRRPQWRQCLYSLAHHPRLGRGSVSDDPRPCPQGNGPSRSPPDCRDGAAARRHRASGKNTRYCDAGTTGGRERTASEYASLLSRAGFRLTQVVPTKSAASIVEAVAV